MSVRLLVVFLLLLSATCVPAGAAPVRVSTNTSTYEDEHSEEAGAPDITTVSVSNDDRGQIRFFVSIPTHPALTQDMRIRIWLSDGDPATGLTDGGADHFVLVDGFLLGLGNALLYDCAGSVCSPVDVPGAAFSYARGASFTIPADALGIHTADAWGATPLDFLVVVGAGYAYDPDTRRFDFTNARIDTAPSSSGSWHYDVRIGPAALVAERVTTTPFAARAGGRLTARMRVDRDDTGTAIRSGEVSCAARIGAMRLPSRPGRFVERRAQCVFDLPDGTRGRMLVGSISVKRGTLTAKRSFVRRIQ